MITRYQDWPERFEAFLRQVVVMRFQYGAWDCCLFVADAIVAMTGTDLAEAFRSKYGSRREALQVAAGIVYADSVAGIVEAIARAHGLREVPVSCARRGDMVLIRRAKGRDASLGIVSLSGQEISIALRCGVGSIPLSSGAKAWAI